jgi:hypothetical protein
VTEAPDVYPDFPDDDDAPEAEDGGVEGRLDRVDPAGEVRTGDPRVDAVLDSLDALDGRPIDQHAEVFERAHEQLRAALEPDRESA